MGITECYNALPAFVEATCETINANTVSATVSAWREQIYNEEFSPSVITSIPFDGMKQLKDVIYSMEGDITTALARYKSMSVRDSAMLDRIQGFQIGWQNHKELMDLRLGYIESYIEDVKSVATELSGGADVDPYLKKYGDGSILLNLKRNIVKGTTAAYITSKDLVSTPYVEPIAVTRDIVANRFLPFLVEVSTRLTGNGTTYGSGMSFADVNTLLIKLYKQGIEKIGLYKDSLLKTVINGAARANKIERLFYQITSIFLQAYQYIVAIYMRALIAFVYNARSVLSVTERLDWKTGDVGTVVTESVTEVMDTCTLEKAKDIVLTARNLRTALLNKGIVKKEVANSELENGTFDPYTYTFPIKTLKELDERLRRLILACKNDPDSPSQDLLSAVGLTRDALTTLFGNTNRAENENFLKTVAYDPSYIYQDLALMEYYLPIMEDGLKKMRNDVIGKYIHALETNVNNVFPNGERNKEIIEVLQNVADGVSTYAKMLAKAYLRRVKSIGDKLDGGPMPGSEIKLDLEPDPYFSDVYASKFRLITETGELDEINQAYQLLWVAKKTGANFFENDGNDNNQNNGNGNNQNNSGNGNNGGNNSGNGNNQNNQQNNGGNQQNGNNGDSNNQNNGNGNNQNNSGNGNNGGNNSGNGNNQNNQQNNGGNQQNGNNGDSNNQNNGNDNNQNQNGDNNNQNGNNQNNNNSGDNKNGEKGTGRLKKLIDDIIDSVQQFFNNGARDQKNKFMDKNKENLENRNYTNTGVPISPYVENKKIGFDPLANLNKMLENVKTIDEATLTSATEEALFDKVFAGVPLPKMDQKASLKDRMIQGWLFGKLDNTEKQQVSDSNLGARVVEMLNFYDNYVDEFIPGLVKIKNNAISDLQNLIDTTTGKNEDRRNTNAGLIESWINYGLVASKSAGRTVYNEYTSILSGLVGGGNNNNNQSNGDNNQQNDNGNNGNNNQ